MFTILVIEDEKIERETLIKILQDAFSDIELHAAKNGVEALSMFEQYHPSIVLADINIPQISGLEVIKKIKSEHVNCECMIISSYNYFNYAQEAIRLGVEDFILKPYNIYDLTQAVEKMMDKVIEKSNELQTRSELLEKIEKITPLMENECFYTILSHRDKTELKRSLHLLDDTLVCGFCVLCEQEDTLQALRDIFHKRKYRVLSEQLHSEKICFVFLNHWMSALEQKEVEEAIQQLHREDEIQLGSIVEDLMIYDSYCIAKEHKGSDFAAHSFGDTIHQLEPAELFRQLRKAYKDMDEEKIRKLINEYSINLAKRQKEDIETCIQFLLDDLFDYVEENYPQMKVERMTTVVLNSYSYQEIVLYLTMRIMKIYHLMLEEKFKNTNQLVRQALKFIDSHYRHAITLQDMADTLHVSPFYISKLLNTSMKKTFTELVSEKRVEASKELLRGNKRIKEIAYEVGFQGQNYFTKIFKKYTGVTPKVYKNSFDENND